MTPTTLSKLPSRGAPTGTWLARIGVPLPFAAVAVAVLLGLLLRLHALDRFPLWIDEIATLGIASLDWAALRAHALWVEANPPGYYLIMWLLRGVAPPDEVWLRMPSVLAGVAAFLPFWLFCRRAFGIEAATCSIVLLAVAAPHVRFSQEARTYALLFLLLTCALLAAQILVTRAITARRRWLMSAVLAGLTAGMIYLHATGIVAGAAVYVYAFATLAMRRGDVAERVLPLIMAGVVGLLLAGPWLLVAARLTWSANSVMSWQPPLTGGHAWNSVKDVLLAPYLSRLAVPVAIGHLLLLGWAIRRRRKDAEFIGCLAALGFALCSIVLISVTTQQILFERTLLFALAFWLALLAAGLGTIRRPAVAATALLLLVVVQARGLTLHYTIGHYAAPWDVVGRNLAEVVHEDDAVLAVGAFEAVAVQHYLRTQHRPLRAVLVLGYEAAFVPLASAMVRPAAVWHEVEASEFCAALQGARALWIVSRAQALAPRRALLQATLQASGSSQEAELPFDGLLVERWSSPRCPEPMQISVVVP